MDLTTVSLGLIRLLSAQECTACLSLRLLYSFSCGLGKSVHCGRLLSAYCGPRRILPEEHRDFAAIRAHRIFI